MITNNFKNILIRFGLWLGLGIATMIVGISGVFADVVNVGYVTNKTTFLIDTGNNPSGAPITLPVNVQNTYGNIYQAFILLDNVEIKKDYKYYLEIYTPTQNLINLSEIHINGNNNQMCQAYGVSDTNIGFAKIWFSCSANMTVLTIGLSDFTGSRIASNGFYWNYTYLRYYTDDNDIDLGPIISNQTNNTNNIINNQNQNTHAQIESQKVCNTYDKSYMAIDNKYLESTGIETANNALGISEYIKINTSSELKVLTDRNDNAYLCFYDTNKDIISCIKDLTLTVNQIIDIPANTEYFRYSFHKRDNRPSYEICKNGNQALDDSINDLNDTLNNSNVDDNGIASAFDDFNDFLDDNSTITQLITLPIILYTSILNNVNGTCQPFNLGQLYGENLILPCINVSQYLGSSLWTMIDIIISGFAVYSISKKMIKVFNNFSSLREGDVIDD